MEKLSDFCAKALPVLAVVVVVLIGTSYIQQIATRAVMLHTMMELRDSLEQIERAKEA